jgi:hypothetical protein
VADESSGSLWGDEPIANLTDGGRKNKELKYWKKPDGHVAVGPRVQSDAFDYQRHIQIKRWKELPDSFGYEEVGSTAFDSMTVGRSKFRKFMKNGGLTARDDNGDFGPRGDYIMPGQQIVVLLGHRDPKVRSARPDVAENAVDVACPYGCQGDGPGGERLFHGWGKLDAETSLHQHITAAHEDAVAAEAVGKQNQEALLAASSMFAAQSGSGGGNNFDAQQMAQIMAQAMIMVNQMQPQPQVFNDTQDVMPAKNVTFDISGKPDMTWQRKHMWQWLKANNVPMPPNFTKLTADDTLKYIEALS